VPEPNAIRHEAVRAQLDRILLSPGFAASPRLCSLLRYLVEQTLNGSAADIKEYSIGLEVFRLPPSFDPKSQSIVRSTAAKLREKLAEFYQGEGMEDPVRIEIPKGRYVPVFSSNRAPAPVPRVARSGWRTVAALAASGVLGLAAIALATRVWQGEMPDRHPSVAVLDIRNTSGNPNDAWLSTALAEMLAENLSSAARLRIVPTEKVAQWRRELGRADVRGQIAGHGRELQDRLSARYAVVADFRAAGEGAASRVDLTLQVLRLGDGKILARISETGAEAQLYSLGSRMAGRILTALKVPPNQDGPQCAGPNCESMRLYAEAVLNRDWGAASKLLEKSIAADPSNFMARSLLAETFKDLGRETEAKIQAQAALGLAAALPPVERMLLEARCQSAMRDSAAAASSYEKLWRVSESVEYGVRLERLQTEAGFFAAARRTLSELRKQPLSLADQVSADFDESLILGSLGQGQQALTLVLRSEQTAKAHGWLSFYGLARLREGGLLASLDHTPKALAALEDSRAICSRFGDRICELESARLEGNYFAINGTDPQRALVLYREGDEMARRMGNPHLRLGCLNGMAYVATYQLRDDEAEHCSQEEIAIGGGRSSDEQNLADLLLEEGRLDEASVLLVGLAGDYENDLHWNVQMAQLERERGNYPAAARRGAVAVTLARKMSDPGYLVEALTEDFEDQLGQGHIAEARADFEELGQSRSSYTGVPYLELELAVAREGWKEAAARGLAERDVCRKRNDLASEAAVDLLLAQAQLELGKPADAVATLDGIAGPLGNSRRLPLQLRARALRLRTQALLGSCPRPSEVRKLEESARKLGMAQPLREVAAAAQQIRRQCGSAIFAINRTAR
jgi:TolB-like protein